MLTGTPPPDLRRVYHTPEEAATETGEGVFTVPAGFVLGLYQRANQYPAVAFTQIVYAGTLYSGWFNYSYGAKILPEGDDCQALPTATAIPAATPTLSDPLGSMIQELATIYGVYLEDTATDGDYDYWRDPTYPQRVDIPSRIETVYVVVKHYDQTILGTPIAPGQNFRAVFGGRTVFRYTDQRDPNNAAAEVLPIQRNETIIILYNLTGAFDRTDKRCGNKETSNAGSLDITRCTIAHELGHVIVARAAAGVNFATDYRFGAGANCEGIKRFDPGENGWPWREHPIRGSGTYQQNLCAIDGVYVIREFEADMIMNYVLSFFNAQDPNSAEMTRFIWIEKMLKAEWIAQARNFTLGD
ncbi:MAG: hypothetical protein HS103_06500 [Anaerolineales bacterium]|nr:hypothetical protein [Anaerolineales bacterium]